MNISLNNSELGITELSSKEMEDLSGGWFWEALLVVGYIALKIYEALSD